MSCNFYVSLKVPPFYNYYFCEPNVSKILCWHYLSGKVFAISVLRWSSLYLSLLFWTCSDFYHLPFRHYDVNCQLYVKLLSKESVEICLGPQKQQLTLFHFLLQKIAETDFSRSVLNVVLIEPLQPDFARIIFYTAK